MPRHPHSSDPTVVSRRSSSDSGITLLDGSALTLVGDLIPFGVWISKPSGRLVYVSDSFLSLVGRTLAELREHGWLDRIHPEDREEVRSIWQRGLDAGTPWSVEYRVLDVNGQEHAILSRGVPVYDEAGLIRSWAGLNLDLSDRKESEIALRKAKNDAEAANRAKDRFLAILSHELRTPLTPLLTAAQLLDHDESVPPHLRKTVETVRRNTELEARLIDDLLDISRIAQGKLSLTSDVVDVHRLVRSVAEMCRRELNLKRLSLRLNLRARKSHVEGDAARIQQILWNLLKNAVKFTPPGGSIQISSRCRNRGGMVELEVQDDGPGIPADQLPYVFDAFHQAGRTDASQVGGLGLGLSITKALVELHSGAIDVESRRGHTCFRVRLQTVEGAEDPYQTGEWMPVVGERDTPPRILLVDDHEDTLALFSMALQRHGYVVITASNVADALQKAEDQPFDVLVSDIGLPDGSGIDLIRQLGSVRGIALTGFGAEEDVRKSREAGFRDHLTKPVGVRQLLSAIQRAL